MLWLALCSVSLVMLCLAVWLWPHATFRDPRIAPILFSPRALVARHTATATMGPLRAWLSLGTVSIASSWTTQGAEARITNDGTVLAAPSPAAAATGGIGRHLSIISHATSVSAGRFASSNDLVGASGDSSDSSSDSSSDDDDAAQEESSTDLPLNAQALSQRSVLEPVPVVTMTDPAAPRWQAAATWPEHRLVVLRAKSLLAQLCSPEFIVAALWAAMHVSAGRGRAAVMFGCSHSPAVFWFAP